MEIIAGNWKLTVCFGSLIYGKKSYYQIIVGSNIPIVDEYGDPIIVNKDGMQYFVYPNPIAYEFRLEDITEIRIHESKKFPFTDEKSPWFVDEIGIHVNNNGRIGELWFDAQKFKELLDTDASKWIEFIFGMNYSGFQYMQRPCDVKLLDD